jgi:hypothetical protein
MLAQLAVGCVVEQLCLFPEETSYFLFSTVFIESANVITAKKYVLTYCFLVHLVEELHL